MANAPVMNRKKPKQMAESKRDVNVVTKKAMAALDYSNSKGVEDSTIVEQFVRRTFPLFFRWLKNKHRLTETHWQRSSPRPAASTK